jgi:hypothetical protein
MQQLHHSLIALPERLTPPDTIDVRRRRSVRAAEPARRDGAPLAVNLAATGWANAYYSATVQAGSQDWLALLFGSFNSSNAITVDKTPARGGLTS